MPELRPPGVQVDGRFKFFGGVVIYANGGGDGPDGAHYKAAEKHGVDSALSARAHVRCCAASPASKACA